MITVPIKKSNLVGVFIRGRRESIGLSQRALGLLFDPPVTTQFISNIERGVTPLPPKHMPTLAKALSITADQITQILGQEYTRRISDRLGQENASTSFSNESFAPLLVGKKDHAFFSELYSAFQKAEPACLSEFMLCCRKILKLHS